MKNVRSSNLDAARPTASRGKGSLSLPEYRAHVTDCRQCMKRRVRCDRSVLQCRKCTIRNLSCPGYHAFPLKWQQGAIKRRKATSQSSRPTCESEMSYYTCKTSANTSEHRTSDDVPRLEGTGSLNLSIMTKTPTIIDGVCNEALSATLLGYFERETASRLV